MQKALEEAKFILDGTDGAGVRFYDRMYVKRKRQAPVAWLSFYVCLPASWMGGWLSDVSLCSRT